MLNLTQPSPEVSVLLKFKISKLFRVDCHFKTKPASSHVMAKILFKTRVVLANVIVHNFSFHQRFKVVYYCFCVLLYNGCTIN